MTATDLKLAVERSFAHNEQGIEQAALIWARAAAQRDGKPLPDHGETARAGILRRMTLPGSRLVIASRDGKASGFTLAAMPGSVLEIFYLAIAPDCWGQGIASRLLREVEDYARSAGVSAIELWVIADNDRAMGLYRSCGYRWTEEQEIDQSSGRVEYLLRKHVSNHRRPRTH